MHTGTTIPKKQGGTKRRGATQYGRARALLGLLVGTSTKMGPPVLGACFVLFCFVWLATLGVPMVASGTAADTFRRVVEAPFSPPMQLPGR